VKAVCPHGTSAQRHRRAPLVGRGPDSERPAAGPRQRQPASTERMSSPARSAKLRRGRKRSRSINARTVYAMRCATAVFRPSAALLLPRAGAGPGLGARHRRRAVPVQRSYVQAWAQLRWAATR